jgi:predicted ArsR family transcriptional regulator
MVGAVVDIGERTPCPVTVLHDDIGMLRIAAILKALIDPRLHRGWMIRTSFYMCHGRVLSQIVCLVVKAAATSIVCASLHAMLAAALKDLAPFSRPAAADIARIPDRR